MMTKQKTTMAERLNIGDEARELKLGITFNSANTTAFHTIKYDFKPASVDINRVATVDVGSSSQVTVTVPNLVNSGVPHTVYKGNHRKYTKECLIIFDKKTGDMTLEKLNHNIQVKKTRSETINKNNSIPLLKLENSTMRVSSKTKVSTGSRRNHIIDFKPRSSPMQQNSPSGPVHKSPQSAPAWNANNAQATLPSIPMIFDDDDSNIVGQNGMSAKNFNSSSMHSSGNTILNEFHLPQNSLSQAKQYKHNSNNNQAHTKKHDKYQKHQQQQQSWMSHISSQQIPQSLSQNQQYSQQSNNRFYQKNNSTAAISSTNNTCVKSINSDSRTVSPNQALLQSLPDEPGVLNQEIGVLSSSDSSSDSDSSASDSVSDSDDSDENFQHHNCQPFPDLSQGSTNLTTSTKTSALTTQQSSDYMKVGFSNDLLHDDLQLSESNTSETSDEE